MQKIWKIQVVNLKTVLDFLFLNKIEVSHLKQIIGYKKIIIEVKNFNNHCSIFFVTEK